MSEVFVSLAREVFAAACEAGRCQMPAGTAKFAEHLDNGGKSAPDTLESLGQQLVAQFPFLRHRSLASEQCDESVREKWEAAVRAVLERLRSWTASNPLAFEELSILLYTIDALGLDSADAEHVASQLRNEALAGGLYHFICSAEVRSFSPGHDRVHNADQEIKKAAAEGNFLRISHIVPQVMPEPRAALWSAVRLLWRLDPAKLADAVTVKDSVFLTLLVRFTLQDEFSALAVLVPITWVKYVGIEDMESAHRRAGTDLKQVDLIRQLLLQAADTTAWAGLLNALVRAPESGSLVCAALPKVLASLQLPHWKAFVSTVSLSFSKRSADPMARIMAALALEVGDSAANALWSMCFDQWNDWNYGKSEHQVYLFSPTACAFDYPVAMYYSKIPGHERDKLEAALTLAVDTIEQQWFNSSTDLITERNRLLCRLRLVVHGRMLASGEVHLLPPEIEPPDAYTSVRYSYFEI
ncbi:hypothetical protein QHI69_04715 [Burkholderia gladioli pv. gladioli]|uniref:Uncharacterized protein n=1 Tax=Burkholderia gladioli TaxID=28095 RepID=A0AAW3F783_BURGA|nr:hypothetical protein [Burkholderia gladioli]AJW97472.1 hypothetical protein BM43_973 [Burkholderia gladioli]ASD80848.1 hypothetical protein CEJ98_18975 [Burkholderia gladioli pv. gladioli]AWY53916.1 hypothetical protein A8H28_22155 [Burkholderia gladioli pv. gladioli]KGC17250.1 hypothetical protein DM48_4672 [Burkholderia gladioli]MDJ1161203.1 hypothetical protein [Burkholderia gladioli pv. gladioli]